MIGYDMIPDDMYNNYRPPRNSPWLTEGCPEATSGLASWEAMEKDTTQLEAVLQGHWSWGVSKKYMDDMMIMMTMTNNKQLNVKLM